MSTTVTTPTTTSAWNLDPVHSVVEFKVRHMMMSNVKGQFTGISGLLTFDEANPTQSRVEASIDVATIKTRDPQRDTHLKSVDFLDVEKYPNLTFTSTSVKRTGAEEGTVTGNLTIHGVTREVVFDVEGPTQPGKDPWGNLRVGVSATTKISRKEFGLTWNATLEAGGLLVGDEVTITIDAQFVKA